MTELIRVFWITLAIFVLSALALAAVVYVHELRTSYEACEAGMVDEITVEDARRVS